MRSCCLLDVVNAGLHSNQCWSKRIDKKNGFKILASNLEKKSLQKCPNFFLRAKGVENKINVESRPRFLFFYFHVSNLNPNLLGTICENENRDVHDLCELWSANWTC